MDVKLTDILDHIDPSDCEYQEWINVGMALKHEGYSCTDWENWSRRDARRFHAGECQSKWNTFGGSASPVTAGTIVQMAKDRGFEFKRPAPLAYDWNDVITAEEETLSVPLTGEGIPVKEPTVWNPAEQIITYLETLFDKDDHVGYVTETWEKQSDDGTVKHLPNRGSYDRTAGELIKELRKCGGDIGAVLGDYKKEAGAWIRFNPLDGRGVKDENVTDYRYALVESDSMALEEQNALIRDLELPVAMLVYTGGKSLHAIVHIDAPDLNEYHKRVDYLFGVCRKNGLYVDKSCRNPSRLSRLPGIERGERKQFIVDSHIGKQGWQEWYDYIAAINDDLPDTVCLADVWQHMPKLAPPLIDGVLRQGHKLLVAGPSKAGKSFALISLCIAIAEGEKWLGFNCAQGKVLYVNLELDGASCMHRFKDVYDALGYKVDNFDKIDILNLRGHSAPMDKLAPKLIHRAKKRGYIAIIFDPIYKILTGDENSAEHMSKFCNYFDSVCNELGCAVIYCHHHSKGLQGAKRSMDRASGSGVFARDPDALLDFAELEITDSLKKQEENKLTCRICREWICRFDGDSDLSQDDMQSASVMTEKAREILSLKSYKLMIEEIDRAKHGMSGRTAWRVEGTLREFPKFEPINLWFDYPIHRIDDTGSLKDLGFEGAQPKTTAKGSPWGKNFDKRKSNEQRQEDRKKSVETAFYAVAENGQCTTSDLAEYMGVSEKTVLNRISEHGGFWKEGKNVGIKAC